MSETMTFDFDKVGMEEFELCASRNMPGHFRGPVCVAMFDMFVFHTLLFPQQSHARTQCSEASHWASRCLENKGTYG